jgi:hypothetical protein
MHRSARKRASRSSIATPLQGLLVGATAALMRNPAVLRLALGAPIALVVRLV